MTNTANDPWRASIERSHERRAAAHRRRRRRFRGRTGAVALAGALALSGGAALAATGAGHGGSGHVLGGVSVATVQRALGVTADGVFGPQTERAVRALQRRHGLAVDGIVGPQTLAALGLGGRARAVSHRARSASTASATLQRIAQCESGGDPHAVSSGGTYRGKYQFTYSTWRSVGGTGDPAKASAAEQDRRAAILYARVGPSAWPACGR